MTTISASAERRFYLSMTAAVGAAIVFGFAKTVFLRPLYPEAQAANEPYFYYLHGIIMFAWTALLVVQIGLIVSRRVVLHRRLGLAAFGLVPALAVSSVYGAILAYRRPGGFIDVPRDAQLPTLGILLSVIGMFALYAGLALALRRNAQSHKRLMIMAAIILAEAAITRWPFAFISAGGLAASVRVSVLLMLPLVAWDLWSRRRLHPATLWGVAGYAVYALSRDALMGEGPVVAALGSLVGPPG